MKKLLSSVLAGLSWIFPAHGSPSTGAFRGHASFYADHYAGKTMANGQPYNPDAFTLACNDIPLGSTVYITYRDRKGLLRSAHATVTDRGPADYLRRQGRIFDFSKALFKHLENPKVGVITVSVQVLTR